MQKATKFNIDLNARNIEGNTAFQLAVSQSRLNIVEIFMKKSADLNLVLNDKDTHGQTALHLARNKEVAEMLVQKSTELNIDLNAKDMNGQTAFHKACQSNSLSRVAVWIDNSEPFKIDLFIKDNQGKTGCQLALEGGVVGVVNIIKRKFRERNIDLNGESLAHF